MFHKGDACINALVLLLNESAVIASAWSHIAGDTFHLLHVVPEPSMIHVWPGMYVPPDDDAEQDEVVASDMRWQLGHHIQIVNCTHGECGPQHVQGINNHS